jgi:hypothetical protein
MIALDRRFMPVVKEFAMIKDIGNLLKRTFCITVMQHSLTDFVPSV